MAVRNMIAAEHNSGFPERMDMLPEDMGIEDMHHSTTTKQNELTVPPLNFQPPSIQNSFIEFFQTPKKLFLSD